MEYILFLENLDKNTIEYYITSIRPTRVGCSFTMRRMAVMSEI